MIWLLLVVVLYSADYSANTYDCTYQPEQVHNVEVCDQWYRSWPSD